jgi:hypothetical protein
MNWETALDLAVARTGHERFRVLCAPSWPDHAAYRQLVLRMAGEKELSVDSSRLSENSTDNRQLTTVDRRSTKNSSPIPLAESLPLLRLVNLCSYRSRDAACGCSGHRCGLRTTSPIVSHLDCLDCMRCYGTA